MSIKHPAKYSDVLLPIFFNALKDKDNVLDPFAGTCKIGQLKTMGYKGKIYCNEIEPEWANMGIGLVDEITMNDAEHLPYPDNFFDAICTSPTYGNRMADHHHAKDDSKRNTYTHVLGRQLHDENTGQMQWGEKYRIKHLSVWKECKRVLKNNGIFILNVSDHIRKGEIVHVVDWHRETLSALGFNLMEEIQVPTRRLRQGANQNLRVDYEVVLILENNKE